MKIFYSIPNTGKLFNHDSPLIQIISLGISALVLLSSATVFAGFALHFKLTGLQLWIYGAAIYPLLSLAPDLINLACFVWVVRTFLKWKSLKQHAFMTGILIAFCVAISGLCTWYSFNLSQVSALQLADWMKPKQQIKAQVDTTLLYSTSNILDLDNVKVNQQKEALNAQQSAIAKVYESQISSLVADSIQWEKGRKESNTLWVEKQIKPVKEKLRNLRFERDTAISNLASQYLGITGKSAGIQTEVAALLLNDTKEALEKKRRVDQEQENRHSLIQLLVSSIAGYAVLILLALGSVREILNHRNGIEPKPVIGPLDFQNFNHIKEVISFPFIAAGRRILNAVRRQYKALPDLEEPAIDSFVFEIGSDPKVIPIGGKKESSVTNASVINASGNARKGLEPRDCINCGSTYQPSVKWQKYCSDNCRLEHHAEKNGGRKFKPGKYHNTRKAK